MITKTLSIQNTLVEIFPHVYHIYNVFDNKYLPWFPLTIPTPTELLEKTPEAETMHEKIRTFF